MFVLMCGLPSSGKSTVVDIIADTESSVWVIRPEDWLPDNIDELNEEDEKNQRIGCWREAMNFAEKHVNHKSGLCKPDDIIILDCSNSKFKPLQGLICLAKRSGHKCVVLYVNSRVAQCASRAGDKWIGTEIAESYMRNIKDSLPKFKSKCDQVIVADNIGDLGDLKHSAIAAWSRLCQTT